MLKSSTREREKNRERERFSFHLVGVGWDLCDEILQFPTSKEKNRRKWNMGLAGKLQNNRNREKNR